MASGSKPAKRLGSVIKLRPDMYEKYKELHAAVWPKVISVLKSFRLRFQFTFSCIQVL